MLRGESNRHIFLTALFFSRLRLDNRQMSRSTDTAATLAQLQKAIILAQNSTQGASRVDTTAIAMELQRIEEALLKDKRRAGVSSDKPDGPQVGGGQENVARNTAHKADSTMRGSSAGRQPSSSTSAAVLVDISEGSNIGGTSVVMTPADAQLHSHNFAEAFAHDDKSRLIFRIDALVNELQRERSKNKKLTEEVIPVLTSRLEQMEREVTFLRDRNQAIAQAALGLTSNGGADLAGPTSAGSGGDIATVSRKVREVLQTLDRLTS